MAAAANCCHHHQANISPPPAASQNFFYAINQVSTGIPRDRLSSLALIIAQNICAIFRRLPNENSLSMRMWRNVCSSIDRLSARSLARLLWSCAQMRNVNNKPTFICKWNECWNRVKVNIWASSSCCFHSHANSSRWMSENRAQPLLLLQPQPVWES